MTKSDENALRVFERKVVRRICGPVSEMGEWRLRNNQEIERELEGEDIVRFIKYLRLGWVGHVERMTDSRMPKRMLYAQVFGTRRIGRPRKRWIDDVEEDLRLIHIEGWRRKARNREEWRRVCRQAKAHPGL